jgi:hypothetical protein
VKINITDDLISIIEYQCLGFDNYIENHATHLNTISFFENGEYKIDKKFIFIPPKYEKDEIRNLYRRAKEFETKYKSGVKLETSDWEFGEGLANYYFLCYLNGIIEARQDFIESRNFLDGSAGLWYTECHTLMEEYEKTTANSVQNKATGFAII